MAISTNTSVTSNTGAHFVIPAIDIIGGKCVRLTNGDYAKQKTYYDDPLIAAKQFEEAGLARLHIVDLDGAKTGVVANFSVLEKIASQTNLVIDFGGGVKNISDVQNILSAGASMVTIGSIAVRHPELLNEWLMEFGPDRFFVGADVLDEIVKISGWQEDSGLTVYDFIGQLTSLGATNIFCTDISKDGLMKGPSIKLYKRIMEQHPEIKLTASGGVASLEDVLELKEIGCAGAIIGKAIYENTLELRQLANINTKR